MKYLYSFESHISYSDESLPKIDRCKKLSEEEFLDILKSKCKNFSFSNDELWRNKIKDSDLQLFIPNYRRTKGITFPDFFNRIENDEEYPVVRKKSLIGGTKKETIKKLVGCDNYFVIPFDDSEIVFCPVIDMWAMVDNRGRTKDELINKEPVDKKHFIKVRYTKDFKIPYKELNIIANTYNITFGKDGTHGYEFFISSPCLLIHESKINWLKEIIVN